MSAHHVLELKEVPRVRLFAYESVRELGSERRETVRFLSAVHNTNKITPSFLVRRGPRRLYLIVKELFIN